MNVHEYSHQRYMRKHHVRMNELPTQIKESIVVWNEDWQKHTPKTNAHPSLERASKMIMEDIEEWLDEEIEEAAKKKPTTYKGNDAVLHKLYTEGTTTVTKDALIEAGYKKDWLGAMPMNCKHYCLRSVKGWKNTYKICKL